MNKRRLSTIAFLTTIATLSAGAGAFFVRFIEQRPAALAIKDEPLAFERCYPQTFAEPSHVMSVMDGKSQFWEVEADSRNPHDFSSKTLYFRTEDYMTSDKELYPGPEKKKIERPTDPEEVESGDYWIKKAATKDADKLRGKEYMRTRCKWLNRMELNAKREDVMSMDNASHLAEEKYQEGFQLCLKGAEAEEDPNQYCLNDLAQALSGTPQAPSELSKDELMALENMGLEKKDLEFVRFLE